MTFTNPIVSGEELQIPSIKSPNYNPLLFGGWSIERNGNATFGDLRIPDPDRPGLYIRLDTVLSDTGRGLIGITSVAPTFATTTVLAGGGNLLSLTATVFGERTYRLTTTPIIVNSTVAGDTVSLRTKRNGIVFPDSLASVKVPVTAAETGNPSIVSTSIFSVASSIVNGIKINEKIFTFTLELLRSTGTGTPGAVASGYSLALEDISFGPRAVCTTIILT